jgi:hypothetical protein
MKKVGYVFSEDVLFSSINSLLFFSSFSDEKVVSLRIVPVDVDLKRFEVLVEYRRFDCFVDIDVDILLKLFNYVSSKSKDFSVSVYYCEDCIAYVSRVNFESLGKIKREGLEFRFFDYNAFKVSHFVMREFYFDLKLCNKDYKDFKNYVFNYFESGACILF